ncbi:WD domain, G-beta repeat [Roseimaritima multifibrata]|uniref:WD domain, G-beta repeat n=1 Tax=Roseimaritima multifibrata TaxID=1930274 RepID=A0A517MGE6_9BACT|nr:hypothetical protein [Roseimaritima multifibrata]QDS93963.1 WD domain, G-beta repeat [Roseimaritima multifibrata]
MADKPQTDEPIAALTPQPIGKPIEYERMLWHARFSPDGQWLVAVGQDAKIVRWTVADPTEENGTGLTQGESLTGHNGWICGLAFHPKLSHLYTVDSWGQLACYPYSQPETSEPLWNHQSAHEGWIRTIAIHPTGTRVATGGNDGVVRIWSTVDGAPVSHWAHGSKVMSLAFTPDGKSLVSGDLFGIIRQWDLDTGKSIRELSAVPLYQKHYNQECGGVRRLVFSPQGDRLAATGQKEPKGGFATGTPCVIVFDWATGDVLREMVVGDQNDGFAYDAMFHSSGNVVACSSAFPRKGPFWLWHPESEQALLIDKKLSNGLSLSLHPDGRRLALLTSNAPNGNGRGLKDGEYPGGRSRIVLMQLST